MSSSIYFHVRRFVYSREGKIHRNAPLGLRTMETAIRDRLQPHGNICKAALTLEDVTVK